MTLSLSSHSFTALSETQQVSATVRDQNGQVMAGASVTWASSDVQVVSVSTTGLLTAVANGSVTVTATSASASATVMVTVRQVAVSITLDATSVALEGPGATEKIEAFVRDSGGSRIPNADVTWSSDDETVAAVASTTSSAASGAAGLATAVAPGSATITATFVADGETLANTASITVGEGILVGPDGGLISLAGGAVMLEFPQGALTSDFFFTADPVTSLPPGAMPIPGTAFQITPGTYFNAPVTVTIVYDPAEVPPGVPPDELRLHRLSYGLFVEIDGSTVNVADHTVSGDIDRSFFGLAVLQAVIVEPPDDPCSDDQGAVTVTVDAGGEPVFDWDPACAVAMLLVEEGAGDRWLILTDDDTWGSPSQANLIVPPIVYGVAPAGVMVREPAATLVPGVTYELVLWRAITSGSTAQCISRFENACLIAVHQFVR